MLMLNMHYRLSSLSTKNEQAEKPVLRVAYFFPGAATFSATFPPELSVITGRFPFP